MNLIRKKIKLDHEKDILTGCIVSNDFIKDMAIVITNNLEYFKSPYIKTVTSWCLEYYKQHDKVPNKSIMDIFASKTNTIHKDEEIESIDDLLSNIAEKYEDSDEEFDVPLKIKQGTDYCRQISLLGVCSKVKGLVESQDITRAEAVLGEYKRVEHRSCRGLDVLNAEEEREKLYSRNNDIVAMRFDGAFGQIIGPLERGGLYILASNAKRGKSFFAIDIAKYCVIAGLNVHYYTLEMKSAKILTRWDMNLAKSLVYIDAEDNDIEFSRAKEKDVLIPYFDDDNNIQYEPFHASSINAKKGNKASKLFRKQYKKGAFHVYDITTSGNTLEQIIANEDAEEQYLGNISDIVIIDSIYLCADGAGKEKRHRYENLHWRAKQDLGEKRNKVVISPYQFNREALKHGGDESNLSESYGVFAHASAALFLNANEEELANNLLRVSASGRDWNYGGEVIVTRQLDLGRGLIDSRWRNQITNYEDVIKSKKLTKNDEEELKQRHNF